MSRSPALTLRRAWFLIHLWFGVGLSLLLVPICVTGAYEVWQDQIDEAMHPARYATTPGPALGPAAYAAAAQAAFGDKARVSVVRLPAHAGGAALVTGVVDRAPEAGRREGAPASAGPQRRPTLTAWVDPATARVLGVADPAKSFKQTMHRLHGSLLITTPGLGRQIVGWLGWALLVSALTGLWLWWPRAIPFVKGFRFRRTSSTLLNLHYLGGFWIALPLAVLALTGALISFPQATRAWISAVASVSPAPQRGGQGGGPIRAPALSIDQAVALAQAVAPGARLTTVSLPTRGPDGPAWRMQFASGGAQPLIVLVSDRDAAAKATPVRDPLPGDAILRANRRIHAGDDGGLAWKLVITVAGLVPALLAVTGVIVWARRQLRRLKVRRPGLVPAGEPAAAE